MKNLTVQSYTNMIYYSMRRKIFKPEVFQGRKRDKNYFEGWYFKHSTGRVPCPEADKATHAEEADSRKQENSETGSKQPASGKPDKSEILGERKTLALIPGISLAGGDDRHAFIQVLDGYNNSSHYIPFPLESFYASRRRLFIQIGKNEFSPDGMEVDIQHPEIKLRGKISYEKFSPFPVRLAAPGIMGWYGFIPFMECFHGVVSMNHYLKGSLELNGESLNFDGGKGYVEKDWGKSFPRDYIWAHCSDFPDSDASFLLSIATIPWLRREFTGFLCFLKTDDSLYRFTTYTGAGIDEMAVMENSVSIRLHDRNYDLWVSVQGKEAKLLAAPDKGRMERFIKESVDSKVRVTLKDKSGNVLFDQTGNPAGYEMVGDVEHLL